MSKNNKNKLVPRLRFPEFQQSGEWEVKRLEEILDYERPDKYIVRDENYTNEGTPVLTANKSFILGYTQETDGICNDIPAIIFDDFTVDKKFVDFPFKVKSSAIKILRAKGKDDLKFLFGLMSLIRFEAKEHKRYYLSTYQKLSVPIPKPAEQQKIASCLSSLDEVIAGERQKLELLQQHKKGLLQQLFPQEGETVPRLRFPEFQNAGEWEVKRLGEVAESVMYGMNAAAVPFDGVNKYIRITDINEETRMFMPENITSPAGKLEDKYIVKVGDLLIARTGASVGKSYLHNKENGKFYFAGFLIRFRIKKEVPYFIYAQTLTKRYQKWVTETSMRSGQPGINSEEYKSFQIFIPPEKSEQQKIASCLSSLDDLITAQTQKIELLEQHKKGLVQGLFPMDN
jgi:type I restriction enzyme S subunit